MVSHSSTALLPEHGGQLRAIAARFSIPESRLLDFSASIFPDGPSPRVLEALADALCDLERLRAYPDLESHELRAKLASYAGVSVHNVLVAHGMVPLLAATLRAIEARKCMLPVPAFGEYRRILHREGVIPETYRLKDETNFQPDLKQLVMHSAERGCDALILTNPHNPTGATLRSDEVHVLVQLAETYGIRVLLDEAFIDFVPEESFSMHVLEANHLIVFRSVTKFFAMAGLRAAYMLAPQHLVVGISRLLDPWSVSTLASIAAIAAVEDTTYIASTVARNQSEREVLRAALSALGLNVYPSRANFLLCRLAHAQRNQDVWERLILDHGIVVRNCATFEDLDETYFRIAVRGRDDNERLIGALDAVLNCPA
ncbi:MAG TPA: aminotransferase class I/II-fold pyridoxal phosphate-dependent enzyme [Acidisarcina sp.]|nr:aminotransferase class I/II-fold pyridoxal phosphate-dependent enzyme [Acidisarcina sp.]